MSNNVRKFINAWDAAKGNESERRELAEDIWYDWFCSVFKDKSLVYDTIEGEYYSQRKEA